MSRASTVAIACALLVNTALFTTPGVADVPQASAATDLVRSTDRALAEDLLALAAAPDLAPAEKALQAAERAIHARQALVGPLLPPEMGPLLDQELVNVAAAREMLALAAAVRDDPLVLGVDLAKAATRWQATTMSVGPLPAPDEATHASLSAAVLAFTAERGTVPTAAQRADIAALDALPEPLRGALARFVDAAAAMDAARPAAVDLARPEGADLAPFLAARSALLDATVLLRDAVDATTPAPRSSHLVQVPPTFSLSLGLVDDTYTQDFTLMIDTGGNDTYHNNAGGAGVLVDLLGNDQYGNPAAPRSNGANGGSLGFLVDAAGNDHYDAGDSGTNGGKPGFLLDVIGQDRYTAGDDGTNGGNGVLIDAAGNDEYSAGRFATNGGARGGAGILLDASGNDVFSAADAATNGGALDGFSAGFLFDAAGDDTFVSESLSNGLADGVNGGARGVGAVGFLFDGIGDDTYAAGSNRVIGGGTFFTWGDVGGVNGGADGSPLGGATGVLIDGEGDDVFMAGDLGTNGGGSHGGVGFLINGDGSDAYFSWGAGGNGGGVGGGVGFLFDAAGIDGYNRYGSTTWFAGSGLNGGGYGGNGFLLDAAGDDDYVGTVDGVNGGATSGPCGFLCPHPPTGLLLDGGGMDEYREGGVTVMDTTVVPKGVVGAQLDCDPADPLVTLSFPFLRPCKLFP